MVKLSLTMNVHFFPNSILYSWVNIIIIVDLHENLFREKKVNLAFFSTAFFPPFKSSHEDYSLIPKLSSNAKKQYFCIEIQDLMPNVFP